MSSKKSLRRMFFLGSILVFLIGCSPPTTPTPIPSTSTPMSIPFTPTPTGPKVGHWEGNNPLVSFDVTSNREIRNFTITVPFATDKCIITVDSAAIETDDTFVMSEMVPTNSGGSEEVNRFSGKFESATDLTGIYGKILICGESPNRWVSMSQQEGKWIAEWKSP